MKYRIRRCNGNRDAWILLALSADGSEPEAAFSYKTAMTIDRLLDGVKPPYPVPGDTIEIVL
jgi:hypothetical protein